MNWVSIIIMSATTIITLILQTSFSIIALVQSNPLLPQPVRDSAIQEVQHAVQLIASSMNGGHTVSPTPASPGTPQTYPTKIPFVAGGTVVGYGDPSVASDGAGSRAWLTFSEFGHSAKWPKNGTANTRLAYSDDKGLTWTEIATPINSSLDVTLPFPPPVNAGTWVNEVSQLVYDPAAATGQHYKLMWYHYLEMNEHTDIGNSWISLKMADSPLDLSAAPEIKLFAGAQYSAHNDTRDGITTSPVSGPPSIALDKVNKDLNSCAAFGEPGLLTTSKALYMSLVCARTDGGKNFVFLMKCDAPCNAASPSSWTYIGILHNQTAQASNFLDGAPGLFPGSDGQVYLTISPDWTGCDIYKFSNLDLGTLETFAPTKTISISHGAACAYNPAASKGGVVSFINDPDIHLELTGINF